MPPVCWTFGVWLECCLACVHTADPGGRFCDQKVIFVTIDKSLKGKGRLSRQRSVLSREERISKMREEDRWPGERSPFGLPKYRVAKIATGKKKKAKEEGEAAAEG